MFFGSKPAQQGARANAGTCHGSCSRTLRASSRRGSSLTLDGIRSFFEARTSEIRKREASEAMRGSVLKMALLPTTSEESARADRIEDFAPLGLEQRWPPMSFRLFIQHAWLAPSHLRPKMHPTSAFAPYLPNKTPEPTRGLGLRFRMRLFLLQPSSTFAPRGSSLTLDGIRSLF